MIYKLFSIYIVGNVILTNPCMIFFTDFQPLKADEDEDDTVVNIMFPLEPPVS